MSKYNHNYSYKRIRLTKPHKANSDHCDQTEMQGFHGKKSGKIKNLKAINAYSRQFQVNWMDVPKAGIDGTLFSRGAGHTINHVSNKRLNEWGKVKRPTSHVTRQANVKRQKL